jgi:hypothetical protein|tara:strand:+ start:52 stop:441 length:390 start_codon:yes stop_codon:yes gene_type:complete
MRQQLEKNEKQRRLKELLLMFLWLITSCVGIMLTIWLAVFNYYLVCMPASLALIAWLVYCVIKGIRTGEWHYTNRDGGGKSVIKRKNEPYFFWITVVFTCPCIVFGLLYWLYVDPLQKFINDGWGGLVQ